MDCFDVLHAFNSRSLPSNHTHQHDYFRLKHLNLRNQVRYASRYLIWRGFPVFGSDVLYYVGNEQFFAVDAVFSQHPVQELSCSPDEGSSRLVFFSSRVLPNQHYSYRVWSFSWNRVLGSLPQSALSAVPYLLVQIIQSQATSTLLLGYDSHTYLKKRPTILRTVR